MTSRDHLSGSPSSPLDSYLQPSDATELATGEGQSGSPPVQPPLELEEHKESSEEASSDHRYDENYIPEGASDVETLANMLSQHKDGTLSTENCIPKILEQFQCQSDSSRLSLDDLQHGLRLCKLLDPNFPELESINENRRTRADNPGAGGDTVNLLNADQQSKAIRGVTIPTAEQIKTSIMPSGSLDPGQFTDTQERAVS